MQHGPSSWTKTVRHIAPASYTATQSGTGLDCSGFDHLKVILDAGTFSGDESVTVTIEGCDTVGGTYVAITSAAFAAITTANDEAIHLGALLLQQHPAFIRATATHTGTGAGIYGVIFELSSPKVGSNANNTFVFELG